MERLLKLPTEYWSSFVNVSTPQRTGRLQQTPSTDSLLRPTNHIFTPTRLVIHFFLYLLGSVLLLLLTNVMKLRPAAIRLFTGISDVSALTYTSYTG